MFSISLLPLLFLALNAVTALPLAQAQSGSNGSNGSNNANATATGYIVKWHPGHVARENRRTWIDNQLRKASLPALTDSEVQSLKIGWQTAVFDGFSGKISAEAAAAFSRTDDVAYVEPDVIGTVGAITTLNNVPWGLQRISQPTPITNGDPNQSTFTYTFDDSAGQGVDIYVVDTGVRTTHQDFGGRAEFLQSLGDGTPGQDVQGHGTHVAGIAAGATHGVANKANIFAVKVMGDDGSAPASDIIAGINFVAVTAAQRDRPAIINLSVTTPGSQALDAACANAVSLGIHVVVAAGNDNKDASSDSPARSNAVITVGATDINDQRATFSNSGPAVDVWAPGVNIISLSNDGDTQLKTLDGTSMATPFVSGLVAYLIALEGNISPAAMKTRIQNLAVDGVISGLAGNTVNTLLFNGEDSAGSTSSNANLQQSVIGAVDGLVAAFSALAAAGTDGDV